MNPAKSAETAELELEIGDGILFTGTAFGAHKSVTGEVVFNTGMVGYTEALTDPSYTGQILVLTYPLAGNYGVPAFENDNYNLPLEFESDKMQVAGLIVSSHSEFPSHYNKMENLREWLQRSGIPAICDVDTRSITKHLRKSGTVSGSIRTGSISVNASAGTPSGICKSTISGITCFNCETPDRPTVILIDCGAKANIIRSLLSLEMNVLKVPYNHQLNDLEYSGILISNGPGNPEEWTETIETLRKAINRDIPILGICLGHQILALAAGASTEKMKYGHRSQNQPCLEDKKDKPRFLLTSQNHGYQVKRDSLPPDWKIWYTNVNDGSIEGIRHQEKPMTGVQFHPESSPGPLDASGIFVEFAAAVTDTFRK
ncbi:MAG: glutamine-hydrolyzing carbamoyl-phosphate synthase small subunit [Candidatus Sabulitectum sp.]|nr:glutamine-hydrolyzing carbamoyl-phosphate synthase small subunit [Candidatus Sabulitectum sp.]